MQDVFVQRVRSALVRELHAGSTELASLSRKLGSSERTLRRQLQARGTSYKELLDEVRHDHACRELALGAPVSEIAERLGFHGSRALHKAFVRWTGLTPSQYRQSLSEEPAQLNSAPPLRASGAAGHAAVPWEHGKQFDRSRAAFRRPVQTRNL